MKQDDLIINLAPTGMVPTRDMSAHVPLSDDEIVADVSRCIAAGVSMVHLHARDEDGVPTWDPEVYRRLIGGIRDQHPDVVVVVSTSGRNVSEIDKRAAALALEGDARPDMASLTLGSMNFVTGPSINAPDTIVRLLERMRENGIRPELEVFDLGMLNFALYLIERGLVEPPYYFNFLLGNIATAQASLLHIGTLLAALPDGAVWSLAGIGRQQTAMNAVGVAMADGVRVGLEDNLWFDHARTRLATNVELVERVAGVARQLGRGIAPAADVRRRLGLAAAG